MLPRRQPIFQDVNGDVIRPRGFRQHATAMAVEVDEEPLIWSVVFLFAVYIRTSQYISCICYKSIQILHVTQISEITEVFGLQK